MHNKVRACYQGVAIGDALGMPVETLSSHRIRQHFPNGIVTFENAVQKNIPEQSEFIAGQTTDDWQLTRVINQSIVAQRDFDILDIAERHIRAFYDTQAGWGSSTRSGVESLMSGRSPLEPTPSLGPGTGGSNGVAMKIAPLGLYLAIRDDRSIDAIELWDLVYQLGVLTHTDSQAWESAFAVAYLIARVMRTPYSSLESARSLLMELCQVMSSLPVDGSPKTVLSRLEWSIDYFHEPEWITENITPGWQAKESVVYAILIALSFGRRFKSALLYAVNDGIDCDSTASIAGAIMGANGGTRPIPKEWREFSPDILAAKTEAEALFRSVRKPQN